MSCAVKIESKEDGIIIHAEAEDSEETQTSAKSGISHYEYYVNGEKQESNEITGITSGVTYTVYVIAYDKAGNPKQSEEQTIKITKKIAKISAGNYHNLAIDIEGNLWAWGGNSFGQIGDGTTTTKSTPVAIMEGRKFKEISAGRYQSLAIDEEGNLWSWGRNNEGQLGDGTTINKNYPVQIKKGTKFTKVVTGEENSLAIDEEGNLWSWGDNFVGQIGDGTIRGVKSSPVAIKSGTKFREIATGFRDNFAIDEAGNLWSWGANYYGELGYGATASSTVPILVKKETKFKQITVGYSAVSLGIDEEGNLWGAGRNSYGELGDGTTTSRTTFVAIKAGTKFDKVITGGISNGAGHTMAIDKEGNLWGCGSNSKGQIGDRTQTNKTTMIPVMGGRKFKEISAGIQHSLAIDEEGNLWTWGNNSNGLGDGVNTFSLIPIQLF